MRDLPPVHPSEVLTEDFMQPLHITPDQLAKNIHISLSQLEEFLAQKQPLTANLALRFARYFGTDPESWLNLQNHYDLEVMQECLHDELINYIQPLNNGLHFQR